MRILLLLMAVVAAQALYAQKITVKGKLVDSSGNPLPMATILFLNPKDSTLVNFGATNKEGLFEVQTIRGRAGTTVDGSRNHGRFYPAVPLS